MLPTGRVHIRELGKGSALMTAHMISTVDEIESVIGKTPAPMHLKVIDYLDVGALRWISQAPLAFAALGDSGGGVSATLMGGVAGWAKGNCRELHLPLASFDDASLIQHGAAFGSLFLLPGIGEALRINGRVSGLEGEHVRVQVEECYGHCGKALLRSAFWEAEPTIAPDSPSEFIAGSRFLALASVGAEGRADLSPKGDPAGCMAQLDGDAVWFADRPGNRRVDSFRNIVNRPQVALLLMIPGAAGIAAVRGRAQITTDEHVRSRFTVKEKTPLLAIRVEIETMELRESAVLRRTTPWPLQEKSDIDAAKLFVEHIKLNKVGGLGASLARVGVSVPGVAGLLKKSLDKDYKDNLY